MRSKINFTRPVVISSHLFAYFVLFCMVGLNACTANEEKDNRNIVYGDLDISGMVQLVDGRYLVVHDTKYENPEPRLGILTVNETSIPKYSPLSIKDENWGHKNGRSNDLESICRLPDETGHQFLMAESGKYKKKYGRIFHIELTQNGDKNWEVHVKKSIPLPKKIKNIEGMGCFNSTNGQSEGKNLLVILGERGGKKPGKILLWELDLQNNRFKSDKPLKAILFSAPDWPKNVKNRDISDIYIDSENTLWISSAEDPGDSGPFKSVIYKIGKIDPDSEMPIPNSNGKIKAQKVWELDGIKVEALAAPVSPENGLSIGTDDENYGGIWRPLFKKED